MRSAGLRIIAGALKGRRLSVPDWQGLRPTSEPLRETLFNILGARVAGSRLLDACAGTGAVGIEAISRGASHVTFMDAEARSLGLIAANLLHCGVTDGYAIIRGELGRRVARSRAAQFDLIFLDPPYEMDPQGALSELAPELLPDGLLVLEHARREEPPGEVGGLVRVRVVKAGSSALAFYRHRDAAGVVSG